MRVLGGSDGGGADARKQLEDLFVVTILNPEKFSFLMFILVLVTVTR